MENKLSFKIIRHFLLPVVCIIVGILLTVYNIYDYTDQREKSLWYQTQAYITDVDERQYNDSNKTIYTLTYEYRLDDKTYTGSRETYKQYAVGELTDISFNPDNPDESSGIIKPDTEQFVVLLIFAIVLIAGGILFTVIIWKERYALSLIEFDRKKYKEENKTKINIKSFLKLLIPIGFFLFGVILMYIQHSGK